MTSTVIDHMLTTDQLAARTGLSVRRLRYLALIGVISQPRLVNRSTLSKAYGSGALAIWDASLVVPLSIIGRVTAALGPLPPHVLTAIVNEHEHDAVTIDGITITWKGTP